MYSVYLSPAAHDILDEYAIRCANDNGMDCAFRYLDAYDKRIGDLEEQPYIGSCRMKYIPDKYRAIDFWPHLWLVYQIKESKKIVYVDHIIDDRQNYGPILRSL